MSKKSEEGWRLADGYRDELVKARDRIAELEATRNELMATVEQVVGRLDKANGELAKYKWMTRQGLIAEYGAQQLDAEYEAQLMGLLETEYVARAEEGGGDETT